MSFGPTELSPGTLSPQQARHRQARAAYSDEATQATATSVAAALLLQQRPRHRLQRAVTDSGGRPEFKWRCPQRRGRRGGGLDWCRECGEPELQRSPGASSALLDSERLPARRIPE